METYKAWDDVPDNLLTKTKLSQEGLRLAKDQKPVAIFESVYYENEYYLYNKEEAVPKRKLSEKQLVALEKARIKARTCKMCGEIKNKFIKLCRKCEHHIEYQIPVIKWAQEVLNQKAIFLDTETTGLYQDDEIVEIAIINSRGETLLDTLVRPTQKISNDAKSIHGISNKMVKNAPSFKEISDRLQDLLKGQVLIAYNDDFDIKMLKQSAKAHELKSFQKFIKNIESYCAMHQFAMFYGELYDRNNFEWKSLGFALNHLNIKTNMKAHRALSDAFSTLRVVEELAKKEIKTIK
jgi:DNA polymerase-3 subunit epsilon